MSLQDTPANDMPFISALRSQIESILLVIDTPASAAASRRPSRGLAAAGASTLSSTNKNRILSPTSGGRGRRETHCLSRSRRRQTAAHSRVQWTVAQAAALMERASRGFLPSRGSRSPARMPTPSSLNCTR